MVNKENKSNKQEEKRVIVTSSGDLMEYEEHISVSGAAKISGGKTNKSIRLSGSGNINGDLECNGLTSSGSLKGSGNLTVHGDVSSSGSFNIAGFLHAEGDGDFSGSTQVGNLINIKGTLINSGSFKAGHFVRAEEGIELSGSSKINGNLSSEKNIGIDGSTNIQGDVDAVDVRFGVLEHIKKQQYKVHGSINAKNDVNVIRSLVAGDVKGRNIKIGRGSEIFGTVYYVDNIEIDKKAKLANEPTQINLDEL